MTDKTDALIARAVAWSHDDPDLTGLVLYGSAARGRTHEASDVDLVLVTRAGRRDQVWARRHQIAEQLLDHNVASSHELPWQGDYRYQAWRADLLGVDLTLDDGTLAQHETFATGQPTVIAGQLTIPPANITSPARQAAELNLETWIWFLGIHNQLQQDRTWDAQVQLVNLLDSRLAPLISNYELVALAPTSLSRDALLHKLDAAATAYTTATQALGVTTSNPLPAAIQSVIKNATRPQ